MKSLKLSLLACVVTTGLALLSCKSDPCEKITYCGANGTATASSDGKSCGCACTAAYMGDSCKKTVISYLSDKIWSTTRTVNGTAKPSIYSVYFTPDGTSLTNIKIQNLGNYMCNPGGSDVFTKAIIKSASRIELDTTTQCSYSYKGGGDKQSDGTWKFEFTATYPDTTKALKTETVIAILK